MQPPFRLVIQNIAIKIEDKTGFLKKIKDKRKLHLISSVQVSIIFLFVLHLIIRKKYIYFNEFFCNNLYWALCMCVWSSLILEIFCNPMDSCVCRPGHFRPGLARHLWVLACYLKRIRQARAWYFNYSLTEKEVKCKPGPKNWSVHDLGMVWSIDFFFSKTNRVFFNPAQEWLGLYRFMIRSISVIWKERNTRVFRNHGRPVASLMSAIKGEVSAWIAAEAKGLESFLARE